MASFDEVMAKINKEFKAKIVTQGLVYEKQQLIPFSSPRANYMTYGGVPRRGMVEFFGEEHGGKTTSALDLCANAQRIFKEENPENPLKVVFVDAEWTLDSVWAATLGVDLDSLYIVRPEQQSAEQVLQMMYDLCKTGEVGLMVLDSVPKLVSKQALDKSIEEKTYAGNSVAITTFVNKFDTLPATSRPCLIMINQLRDNLGDDWKPTKTPGGRAVRHEYKMRIQFSKGPYIDDAGYEQKSGCENPQGNIVRMRLEKNKVTPSDRRVGFYTLKYRSGVYVMKDLIDAAKELGYIQQSGSWYVLIDPETQEWEKDGEGNPIRYQGIWKFYDFFWQNPDWFKYLNDTVLEKLSEVKQ